MPKTDLKNTAIFMPDKRGFWSCCFSSTDCIETGELLACVCQRLQINLPDTCVFARMDDGRTCITYRVVGALKITISINPY